MSLFSKLFPPPAKDAQMQTDDGRTLVKITNTAPPEDETFEAELPPQPTTDIATYLRTTPRVKKDDQL